MSTYRHRGDNINHFEDSENGLLGVTKKDTVCRKKAFFLKNVVLRTSSGSSIEEQESIPAGCVPLICQPYFFW